MIKVIAVIGMLAASAARRGLAKDEDVFDITIDMEPQPYLKANLTSTAGSTSAI